MANSELLVSEGVDPADFQIKAFLHKRHVRDFVSEIFACSVVPQSDMPA